MKEQNNDIYALFSHIRSHVCVRIVHATVYLLANGRDNNYNYN